MARTVRMTIRLSEEEQRQNQAGAKRLEIAPGAPKRELSWAEADRYRERTMIERVNGNG